MAHFAHLDFNNQVIDVIVIDNEHENNGQEFINNVLKLDGKWLQTSYNTFGGVHALGGIPLRKNYAGVGFTYDEVRDAFISPSPFSSWVLNEDTCNWEAPTPMPSGDGTYKWVEDDLNWQLLEGE